MSSRPIHPAWGFLEIVGLGGLFLFVLWVAGPRIATSGAALGFYWAAVAIWTVTIVWLSPIVLHRDPPELRGWGWGRPRDDPGTLRNAWPSYAGFTAVAGLGLMIAVALRDPAFLVDTHWRTVGAKLLIYVVYGAIQAMIFFGYVQTRVRTGLGVLVSDGRIGRPLTALITAGLFAMAHAPNWPLAALVLVAGLGWSWLYYVRPSVLLVGMSHAVLGTIVYSILHVYTRIGPFYAHPEGHIATSAIPGLKALVGDLF